MGKTAINPNEREFTQATIKDRELIIKMLKREDEIFQRGVGQEMYKNPIYQSRTSLDAQHTIQRMVLTEFGFTTSESSLKNYRTIFQTYWRSPVDYDKEVMQCVVYFRENKCIYYARPELKPGDTLTNVKVLTLDGKDKKPLYGKDSVLGDEFKGAFVCAFSSS